MTISNVTERETSNKNGHYYIIEFANGPAKTSALIFTPRADEKYDPSRPNNRLCEELFASAFNLDMDPNGDSYAENIMTGYNLIIEKKEKLKGLHTRLKLGYNGLHAKYFGGESPYFMLCRRNGEPMKGYEETKFDSREAVEAELGQLNSTRPADKQFRFHKFPEVQEFLPTKEDNSALLAKFIKPDGDVDNGVAADF